MVEELCQTGSIQVEEVPGTAIPVSEIVYFGVIPLRVPGLNFLFWVVLPFRLQTLI